MTSRANDRFTIQGHETGSSYRVRCTNSRLNTGSPARFAVEVYDPQPRRLPWRVVEEHGSYDAAADRAEELRRSAVSALTAHQEARKARADERAARLRRRADGVLESARAAHDLLGVER